MGTGKSTVGRLIALRLNLAFADTDSVIENRERCTIPHLFKTRGEAAFRALERDLCKEIGSWRRSVIATGGGMVVPAENRAALIASGFLVCLDAPVEVIFARLAGQNHRPLLRTANPQAKIAELLAARAEAYTAVPYHIETGVRSPALVAEEIIRLWVAYTMRP